MKNPAYHLRTNKAAERLAFIDAIRRLERLSTGGFADYTYFGMGGPYLEDFRLLYEFCPDIGMVSFETEAETFKRQKFHLPSSKVQLIYNDIGSYISHYNPGETKSIFWLDYTDLEYRNFEDFMVLLSLVEEESMIKITLRCVPESHGANKRSSIRKKKTDEFRNEFRNVMPLPSADPPSSFKGLALFLQEMLQVAVVQALPPSASSSTFVPVSSFYYSDGTGMFTLTGIVCDKGRIEAVKQVYADWEFANLDWLPPNLIKVPVLSTKERLHLQGFLPSDSNPGIALRQALGYRIDIDDQMNEAALEQYAVFHRYSPYFLRGVP